MMKNVFRYCVHKWQVLAKPVTFSYNTAHKTFPYTHNIAISVLVTYFF